MVAKIMIRNSTFSEHVRLLQRRIQSKDRREVSKARNGVPQITRHRKLEPMAVPQETFDPGQQRFMAMLIESMQRNAGGNRGGNKLFHCKSGEDALINFNLNIHTFLKMY